MSGHQHLAVWFGLVCFGTLSCRAADLQEIISRGSATLKSDWAADQNYAYIQRDEVQKRENVTSKTSRVVTIDGSDYFLLLAVDDHPLSPEREKEERDKLRNEVLRRKQESPDARQARVRKFEKERNENEALVLDFPTAFNFELLREETMNGHGAYVLSGMPKQRTGQLSLAAKVLSGMRGTIWVDKENFHAIRASCEVMSPVPIYGILAKVLPGTHIEFAMAPVTDSVWLISELSMDLRVSKLFFKSTQNTRTTYSAYRLNTAVLDELLKQ
jgi:outer membrane lipoprotein-sorting protein